MTDNNHPITPPPELVKQWQLEGQHHTYETPLSTHIATQAARWGADQELEACCERLTLLGCSGTAADVRSFRRPPSLKAQALEALKNMLRHYRTEAAAETIRRALESLPD